MAVQVASITQQVVQKITQVSKEKEEASHGLLYGSVSSESVTITAACYVADGLKSGNFLDHSMRNRCMFPVGADPIGAFFTNCSINEVSNIIPIGTSSILPENMYCIHVDSADSTRVSLYHYNRLTKSLSKLDCTELNDNPFSNHIMLRLTTTAEIVYKFSTKKAELHKNCVKAIDDLISSYCADNIYYQLLGADIIVGTNNIIGSGAEESLERVIKSIEKSSDNDIYSRKKKPSEGHTGMKVLYLDMLTQLTQTKTEGVVPFSPVIHCNSSEELVVSVNLPINSVVLADKSQSIGNIVPLLQRSVRRQLHAASYLLPTYSGTEVPALKISHYWLNDLYYPLSILTSASSQDSDQVEWRKSLHVKLMLPLDRPCFKSANVYIFPKDATASPHLINPHVGLPQTKQFEANNGIVRTVYGKYAYHHYMQDKFNDDKWGCAYRSLQTVVSWFRLQGYTNVSVPTHRDIQQILVDIGDKEPSFVGSRQWIGSTEVSFVLEKLLDVTSKIQYVSSGADLANKGRELIQHFTTQGTPIMIGGGVLAHTILGVCFNENTGDIKFLILDPHYTGSDELRIVQDKGWCGWKNADFWDASAYYNMCMPQRPIEF